MISRGRVALLAQRYISFYKLPMTREEAFSKCHERSRDFYEYARAAGFTAGLIGVGHMRRKLPKDAHWLWRDMVRQEPGGELHIGHYAVRIGSWVVDLSGAQFGAEYSELVQQASVFLSRWEAHWIEAP